MDSQDRWLGGGQPGVGTLRAGRVAWRGHLRVGVATLVAAVSFAVGLGPTSVAAGAGSSLPGISDITATAMGRALAQAAAGRYRVRAAGIATADLVVLQDAAGITIGPRSGVYTVGAVRGANGALRLEAVPTTIGRGGAAAASVASVAAVPVSSWSFVANQCFTRISDGYTWLDHCYTMYRLANDGDAGRDWFALNHFATMQANVPWVMNAASIGSAPAGGSTQAWADWAPRSDMNARCHDLTVGVLVPVGGIGDTVSQCETWTITKSATAGLFAVKWDGRGQHAARELSMEIAVSVPQGGWPIWSLPASVSGSFF